MPFSQDGFRFYDSVTVANGQTSTAIPIPPNVQDVSAAVIPAGGDTVRLEFTLDDPALVVTTPASCTWVAWTPGGVTAVTAQSLVGSITGVRAVSTGVGTGGSIKVAGRRVRG